MSDFQGLGGRAESSIHLLPCSRVITIADGISTRETAYEVTATPIQIRFRAAESTVVPVPTDSLSLPRGYLLTREKVGIGVGVLVAVGLLTMVLWYFCCGGGGRERRGLLR
jgi:hypothetical protein